MGNLPRSGSYGDRLFSTIQKFLTETLPAVLSQRSHRFKSRCGRDHTFEAVPHTIGRVSKKLRAELGEPPSTVQKFDVPLSEATTPSLEALSTYASALKAYNEQGVQAALALDQHAIELDPSFAMAYYDVGDDYFSLNQLERASQYYTKAFELRQHANDRSKLMITGNYYSTVTGEHDKGARTFHDD